MSKNTPEEAFVSLAKKRMPRLLKLMKLVENLSNPYHYDYTDAQVKKIIKDIKDGLEDIQRSFDRGLKSKNKKKNQEYEI